VTKAKKLLECLLIEIAQHETHELNVQFLSHKVGLSRWQLQRTFKALTGFSLIEYLREHRICFGAKLLLNTKQGVLDVAFASGFTSQAAFSRAFKNRFCMTPIQYRQRAIKDDFTFNLFIPANVEWSKAMTIRIEKKSAMVLEGRLDYFNGYDSQFANNLDVIPSLWESLMQDSLFKQKPKLSGYGYIGESDDTQKGELIYLASIDHSEGQLTQVGVKKELAEQVYAIVPHHGRLTGLGNTLDAFYGQWLIESDYKMSGNFSIEFYDARFDPGSDDSYFETWIPIQIK